MADAWGGSWGESWGVSWGAGVVPQPQRHWSDPGMHPNSPAIPQSLFKKPEKPKQPVVALPVIGSYIVVPAVDETEDYKEFLKVLIAMDDAGLLN